MSPGVYIARVIGSVRPATDSRSEFGSWALRPRSERTPASTISP